MKGTLAAIGPDLVIVRAVQRTYGSPVRWDAWDTEGNYYYLRYWGGRGTVLSCSTPDHTKWTDEEWRNPVASFDSGHRLSSYIPFDEFCAKAGLMLAPMIEYAYFGRYYTGVIGEIMKVVNRR